MRLLSNAMHKMALCCHMLCGNPCRATVLMATRLRSNDCQVDPVDVLLLRSKPMLTNFNDEIVLILNDEKSSKFGSGYLSNASSVVTRFIPIAMRKSFLFCVGVVHQMLRLALMNSNVHHHFDDLNKLFIDSSGYIGADRFRRRIFPTLLQVALADRLAPALTVSPVRHAAHYLIINGSRRLVGTLDDYGSVSCFEKLLFCLKIFKTFFFRKKARSAVAVGGSEANKRTVDVCNRLVGGNYHYPSRSRGFNGQ